MNHRDNQPRPTLSLSETHVGGIRFAVQTDSHCGRGCLLKIYPASVDSDIVRLGLGSTLIGRDTSCDIVLDDNAVSRHHAVIEADQDGYSLRDLGSTNGTYIDDALIPDVRRLQGGELIRVGGTILKFMSSMDEEVQYHAVVRQLMTRDALTNAYNRSYLMPLLQKCVDRIIPDGVSVALIMMDVDHFKSINDSYGHVVGDEVLRVFAERVRSALRKNELLARFGGEEFLVVATDCDEAKAIELAESLRREVAAEPFHTQVGPVSVTCSLGIATSEKTNPLTVDQFLSSADAALYEAKNSGRNAVAQR